MRGGGAFSAIHIRISGDEIVASIDTIATCITLVQAGIDEAFVYNGIGPHERRYKDESNIGHAHQNARAPSKKILRLQALFK